MKTRQLACGVLSLSLVFAACGQEDVVLPDMGGGVSAGECGAWYPGGGGDAGTGDEFGIEKDKIFPCAVWESAREGGQDTYINVGDVYLGSKHAESAAKAIVIVVSARNCPTCGTLMSAIESIGDEFDAAGAMMIAMARRDLKGNPEDPDFPISEAELVLDHEGWPVEKWFVINDAEGYLERTYDVGTPWTIVVDVKSMVVRSVSNEEFSPSIAGAEKLLQFVKGF
ncbi:MAG: hypothetical protein GY854_01670 [Deltaproteobacteria bacterium]|nr:hypothetical protein [Deltaproteobacteria bacterium]